WTGRAPAGPTRWPWRASGSGSCPNAASADDRTKLQFAVLAVAALHGGTEPGLLDEVAWWQTDDFWENALFATVAYIRAAANRAGVPVRRVCQDLGQHHDLPAS